MQNLGQLLVAAVCGAVAAVGMSLGFGLLEESPPIATDLSDDPFARDTVNTSDTTGITDPTDRTSPQLTRIEARLAKVAAAIEALEKKVDALPTSERTPLAPPASGVVMIDENSILRALERVEEKRFEAFSVDELMKESRRHLKANDSLAARRALEAVLARTREPEDRANALTQLGIIHRSDGDSESSARVLQSAINEFGIDSTHGAQAAYQLVWTRRMSGDSQAALQLANTIAKSPNVGDTMRLKARWAAALMAEASGDANRARADFQSILRDYGHRSEPAFYSIIQDIKRRLGKGK